MELLAKLIAMLESDGRAVLVTLTGVRGSSPREEGARMAVRADGAFAGSIGGGTLEWQALAEAQHLLAGHAGSACVVLDRALGPDLGQCCGGRVTVSLERLDAASLPGLRALRQAGVGGEVVARGGLTPGGTYDRWPATPDEIALLPAGVMRLVRPDGTVLERFGTGATSLALFGAGHVGRALVLALAPLPFRVTWVDARPDAFPPHIPINTAPVAEPDAAAVLAAQPDGAVVLAMTHSHALDLEVVTTALAARRFAAVGVIGSMTKRRRFIAQMQRAGLPEALAGSLLCPIGVPGIEGKDPAVIAASMAAHCLMLREGMADARIRTSRRSDARLS